MGSDAPALIACSHGTASPEGQAAVAGLVAAVAAARPDLEVHGAFVDVQQPDPAAVLDTLPADREARLVPLLLSAGYHVFVDLTDIAAGRAHTVVAPALGPDPRLVALLHRRLVAAGLRDGDRVVLAPLGSSDGRAVSDCAATAAALAASSAHPSPPPTSPLPSRRLADAVVAQTRFGRMHAQAEARGHDSPRRRRDLPPGSRLLRRARRGVRCRRRHPAAAPARRAPAGRSSSTSWWSATSADQSLRDRAPPLPDPRRAGPVGGRGAAVPLRVRRRAGLDGGRGP